MTPQQFQEITEWQKKTFGQATAMSNERKPLLTEEQIQEMVKFDYWMSWLRENAASVFEEVMRRNPNRNILLAFLRGRTKRIFNLDRLRKDVKAWVDDPDRKYPEWQYYVGLSGGELVENYFDVTDGEGLCCYALAIGINPDDYFEEVEVTE